MKNIVPIQNAHPVDRPTCVFICWAIAASPCVSGSALALGLSGRYITNTRSPFRTCQGDRGKREGFGFRELLKTIRSKARQNKTHKNCRQTRRLTLRVFCDGPPVLGPSLLPPPPPPCGGSRGAQKARTLPPSLNFDRLCFPPFEIKML